MKVVVLGAIALGVGLVSSQIALWALFTIYFHSFIPFGAVLFSIYLLFGIFYTYSGVGLLLSKEE